jgi:hypothetical protein
MNKKLSNGNKVAQIAQRFNQIIQQDATILDEVKKHGSVVVHRSGGRVFKIKEEKASSTVNSATTSTAAVNDKATHNKKINDDTNASDDAISIGKNSTRRKSTLKKRPSIRIMVEKPRKDSNGNVLSKRQLYEANVINKETIVIKPKVPEKSERVLTKTKELKSKKLLNEIKKTEKMKNHNEVNKESKDTNDNTQNNISADTVSSANNQMPKIDENVEVIKDSPSKNNLRKIYEKISFRPTFLYGKKSSSNKPAALTNDRADEVESVCEVQEVSENSSLNSPDGDTNDFDDEFDLKPIDLNLNVYFNNENLSENNNIDEDKNVNSQGPLTLNNIEACGDNEDDVTQETSLLKSAVNEQKSIDVRPNSSFLFRINGGKPENACDTFMRNMLNERDAITFFEIDCDDVENEINTAATSSSSTKIDLLLNSSNDVVVHHENDYEIISRGNEKQECAEKKPALTKNENSECGVIDDGNNNNVILRKRDEDLHMSCDVEEENIYQSLCEVKGNRSSQNKDINDNFNNHDTLSDKSYESFENYDEIKQNILDNKINITDILKTEDDYIFPQLPPELPAPRQKTSIPKISSPILTSSTSNLVQADLPKQQCNYELQKSNSCVSTTYERIKYDPLPHAKHQHMQTKCELPLPPRNTQPKNAVSKQQHQHDENIYDTIKSNGDNRSTISSIEYEKIPEIHIDAADKANNGSSMKTLKNESYQNMNESFDLSDDGDNPYKNSKNDTMSIISNCYESISLKQSYSTINQILRHAISTNTLSSEHRINSIYGIGQSLTPPSDRSGSDNSDEWIDVESEDEAENNNNNKINGNNSTTTNDRFIV